MKKLKVISNGDFQILYKMNHNKRLANEFECAEMGCWTSVSTYEDCEQDRKAMEDLRKHTMHVLAGTGSYWKIEEVEA